MSDRERERIEPTPAGQARLLAAIGVGAPACVVDPGALGEYAAVRSERGQAAADARFPDLAGHLASGCARCANDLLELLALLAAPDEPLPTVDASQGPDTAVSSAGLHDALLAQDNVSLVAERPTGGPGVDRAPVPPGHAAPGSLPPAGGRQALRTRDWLLIGAAAVIVVVGVVLLGLAYLASRPAQPAPVTAPAGAPAGARALPSGMNCPATNPVKGNRESMIYHLPDGQFYAQTRPEECFATPADAEAAGYRRSLR